MPTLFVTGETLSGKTTALKLLEKEFINQGKKVKYLNCIYSKEGNSTSKIIKLDKDVDVLILDDFDPDFYSGKIKLPAIQKAFPETHIYIGVSSEN